MREVSSQNSFNSMNMLNVHFGFGDAVIIDSLVIIWTKGIKDVYTNVDVNKFYEAVEGSEISIISSIIENINNNPSKFNLLQNYPNPFNPSTKLSFSIGKAGNVNLVIYNELGQKIRTLINDDLSGGLHEILWNGKNESGLSVPSGIYYARIIHNGLSKSIKMMLIK